MYTLAEALLGVKCCWGSTSRKFADGARDPSFLMVTDGLLVQVFNDFSSAVIKRLHRDDAHEYEENGLVFKVCPK
jgi:hypothetical protein